ncbi:TPA: hypothetical protein RK455_003942 [Enterobacter ludwigii]|uniref:hypothetical protein n=1 Tax=Enterobacter ludwigii TaxID=299767 RepID=UPI0018C343D9|nr:hypothetical protein [Enterobacter ludwigii]MBG0586365.1 hypothetical protein [Enterobacter ludwigii]HDW2027074.1 hypothetical protein [Enterobacter ludwigii]
MLDFIKDIFSSFRQTSLERIKSPVLGGFVFSWIAFNWKTILILISSTEKIEERLSYVQEHYFNISTAIIGPLCTTALICFFLPRVNKFVTNIQKKPSSDNERITLQSRLKISRLQQRIANVDARKSLAKKIIEREIDENIKSIKIENESLVSQNENLTIQLNDYADRIKENIETIKNTRVRITQLENDSKNFSQNIINAQTLTNSLNEEIKSQQQIISEKDTQLASTKEKLAKLNACIQSMHLSFPNVIKVSDEGLPIWSQQSAAYLMSIDIKLRQEAEKT